MRRVELSQEGRGQRICRVVALRWLGESLSVLGDGNPVELRGVEDSEEVAVFVRSRGSERLISL